MGLLGFIIPFWKGKENKKNEKKCWMRSKKKKGLIEMRKFLAMFVFLCSCSGQECVMNDAGMEDSGPSGITLDYCIQYSAWQDDSPNLIVLTVCFYLQEECLAAYNGTNMEPDFFDPHWSEWIEPFPQCAFVGTGP